MTDIFEDEANQILELNSQKQLLNDLVSKCKKLVGSFKHNDGLVRRLKEKQDSFNYELKVKLVQDMPVRWISTFDMIDTILINKDALISMSLERINAIIKLTTPSENEWNILEKLCELLEPLKDLTTSLSASKYVTISLLYPAIYNLINYEFPNMTFKNESIIALLEDLLYSLKNRFKLVLEDDFFVVATYLNFRFKKFEFIKDKLEQ